MDKYVEICIISECTWSQFCYSEGFVYIRQLWAFIRLCYIGFLLWVCEWHRCKCSHAKIKLICSKQTELQLWLTTGEYSKIIFCPHLSDAAFLTLFSLVFFSSSTHHGWCRINSVILKWSHTVLLHSDRTGWLHLCLLHKICYMWTIIHSSTYPTLHLFILPGCQGRSGRHLNVTHLWEWS